MEFGFLRLDLASYVAQLRADGEHIFHSGRLLQNREVLRLFRSEVPQPGILIHVLPRDVLRLDSLSGDANPQLPNLVSRLLEAVGGYTQSEARRGRIRSAV